MKEEVREVLERFVSLVDNTGLSEDEALKSLSVLCDELAVAVPRAKPELDEGDYGAIPERDYKQARTRVERRFPGIGLYNEVLDVTVNVGETPLGIGDSVDDLADMLGAIEQVLWSWEHQSPSQAAWHLWDSYKWHWGEHLRWLQLYLYCRERSM